MADVQSEAAWSYYVLRIKNPSLPMLQQKLTALGADGWELVSSLTTVKWIAVAGNTLVFIFRKPGFGHVPYATDPTIEQQSYLLQVLRDRGFDQSEIDAITNTLRARGLWSADSVFDVSTEWQTLDRTGITAWLDVAREPSDGA